jgi:hypothetical protein
MSPELLHAAYELALDRMFLDARYYAIDDLGTMVCGKCKARARGTETFRHEPGCLVELVLREAGGLIRNAAYARQEQVIEYEAAAPAAESELGLEHATVSHAMTHEQASAKRAVDYPWAAAFSAEEWSGERR